MLPNFADLRRGAQRRLPRCVFDYVDGAAEDERCLQRSLASSNACICCRRRCATRRIDTTLTSSASVGRRRSGPPRRSG
jgi:(S)-mandelate dehydrogenase